jgi:serine/threonine-protein kinase
MGTVYAAENVEIGRQVAIKVLNGQLAGNQPLVTRFRMEARAAALIRHPGIVDVLDMGTADDGAPYIVMELLEGETLGAIIERREPLAPARLTELIAAALDALAAAHRAGIVHRDLKPDNLFICREGPAPVKLVDFGISKFGMAEGLNATQSGLVMGTPLYMAPEQIRSAKDAGPPADLYAIGAICFHALTGRPPYPGESFSEVVAKVVTDPVPSLRQARPDLPPVFADVVERLLAKAPADRPADAAAVAAELRAIRFVTAAPTRTLVAPPPVPAPPSSPRLRPRRRLVSVALVTIAGMALIGLGSLAWLRRSPPPRRLPDPPIAASTHAVAPADAPAPPLPAVATLPATSAVAKPSKSAPPQTSPVRHSATGQRASQAQPRPKPPEPRPKEKGLRLIGDNPYEAADGIEK